MYDKVTSLVVRAQLALSELREEKGQAMVEYALILGLISVVAIVSLTAIGTNVDAIFGVVKDKLAGAVPGP
jgi:pilus assembly protein Flp/PilA